MIAALALVSALAASPCLTAEYQDFTPADAIAFGIKPAEDGLTLDESTYNEWLWERTRLAGCLTELHAALAAQEETERLIDWVKQEATEAIHRARPTWVQRNGLGIGMAIGAALTVALVAAIAKTFTVSIQ